MASNTFIYTLNILIIFSYLLSGIFIVLVRGAKPPMRYILLNRFLGALFGFFILLQVHQTPLYGKVLWNPSIVLMSLTLYPLLFLYVFDMLRPDSKGVRLLLFTFLPTVVFTVLYVSFEALFGRLPLFAGYASMRNYLDMPQLWVSFAATGFSVALMCLFSIRAIRGLKQHKRNIESNFSYKEGITFEWMWLAIGIAMFEWCLVLATIMVEGGIAQLIGMFVFIIEPILLTALIVRQKDLYNPPVDTVIFKQADDVAEWTPKKHKQLKHDLLALLKKDEIFRDPDLCTAKVCAMLGTNRTYLWQVLKDMGKTFYQLINESRLNKSVSMMKDPQHRDMQIQHIAEICGFKSSRAFSTIFKQNYGKTPMEWRIELWDTDV